MHHLHREAASRTEEKDTGIGGNMPVESMRGRGSYLCMNCGRCRQKLPLAQPCFSRTFSDPIPFTPSRQQAASLFRNKSDMPSPSLPQLSDSPVDRNHTVSLPSRKQDADNCFPVASIDFTPSPQKSASLFHNMNSVPSLLPRAPDDPMQTASLPPIRQDSNKCSDLTFTDIGGRSSEDKLLKKPLVVSPASAVAAVAERIPAETAITSPVSSRGRSPDDLPANPKHLDKAASSVSSRILVSFPQISDFSDRMTNLPTERQPKIKMSVTVNARESFTCTLREGAVTRERNDTVRRKRLKELRQELDEMIVREKRKDLDDQANEGFLIADGGNVEISYQCRCRKVFKAIARVQK